MKAATSDYKKIEVSIPLFYGVVGNFPYIRQELIERQIKGYKNQIVLAVARQWFWHDRDLFRLAGIRPQEIDQIHQHPPDKREQWLEKQVQEGRVDLRLSGQADIYAYLFFHAAAFLEEGGRIGIVTSNAWLDVAYGVELKRFFLRHFKIVAVVASWCEPWFEDAAINTAFVILERCTDPQARAQNVVRFVKVKKPLAELLPQDLLLQENARWQKVDALVRQIEAADAQITSWDPATGQVQPLRGVHTVETDAFRIRLVPQAELEAELEAKGETAKWGLYIRAPQVYFDILREAGDKLVPLGQVAEVRRGYTTGINDFFYLEPLGPGSAPGILRVKNARGWVGEMEEACLRPVIKSPKEAKGLVVDPQALRYRLFLPPIAPSSDDPERDLRTRFPLAYRYVKWGEGQRTPQGQPWPQVPSVQGRKAWWLLSGISCPELVWIKGYDKTFRELIATQPLFADQQLYPIRIREIGYSELMGAVLNSSWVFLQAEISGRVNFGDGVLWTAVYEVQDLLVPSFSLFPDSIMRELQKALKALKQRPIKPIAQEVKQKDRRALDAAVLKALGLDPKEYLPRIYEGLVEMVEERLALPKRRKKLKKQERRLSLEQVKERMLKEVLPGGLKPIAAFLPAGRPAMLEVALTGRPVTWKAFLTAFTLLDAEGKEAGSLQGDESQARYAIYAAQPGEYLIKVPADPILAAQTVQKYEQYLRQVAQELSERALEATHDHRQAERAIREILESFGLPPLAVSVASGR